uniref:Uncharacterized protein n=1 Tax=viral metagenome TaxID=1070528 RepID=A0A6M3IJZ7_9ZZZZ
MIIEDAWDEKQKAWGRSISMDLITQAEIERKDKPRDEPSIPCYMYLCKGFCVSGGPHSAMKSAAKMVKCEKCNGTGKI